MKNLSSGNTLWNISRVFRGFLTKKTTGFQYTLAWSKLDNFVDVKYFMIKIYSYINGDKLQQYTLYFIGIKNQTLKKKNSEKQKGSRCES